jgi:ketosteroid isomerase-like protein
MSQENVEEVVRAANEAWNAGDLNALREVYDPNIVVRVVREWPEQGPFIGIEAVIRQWERQREAYDAQTLEEISEIVVVGNRATSRIRWRGSGQGPGFDLEFTALVTVRDGRIVMIDFFWDHAEALEAVGLSEQDAHADS